MALKKSEELIELLYQAPVPSINSSALKYLNFSDTARLEEFFDHTGIGRYMLGVPSPIVTTPNITGQLCNNALS